MRTILIFLTLVALMIPVTCKATDVTDAAVSAAFSLGTYYVCRKVLESESRFGCAFAGLVVANLLMINNISTSDNDNTLGRKMRNHAIGSSIVIPIALFE